MFKGVLSVISVTPRLFPWPVHMDAEEPYHLHVGEQPTGPEIDDLLRTPCVGDLEEEDLGFLVDRSVMNAPRKRNANERKEVEKRSVKRSLCYPPIAYESADKQEECEAKIRHLQYVMESQVACNNTVGLELEYMEMEMFLMKQSNAQVQSEMQYVMTDMIKAVNERVGKIESTMEILASMLSTQAQTNKAVMQHLSDLQRFVAESANAQQGAKRQRRVL